MNSFRNYYYDPRFLISEVPQTSIAPAEFESNFINDTLSPLNLYLFIPGLQQVRWTDPVPSGSGVLFRTPNVEGPKYLIVARRENNSTEAN